MGHSRQNFEKHPASSGEKNKDRVVLGLCSLTQDVTFPRQDGNKAWGISGSSSISGYCIPALYSYSLELQDKKEEKGCWKAQDHPGELSDRGKELFTSLSSSLSIFTSIFKSQVIENQTT